MPQQLGFIWPKDPRPGNPSRWPRRWRLFDVLTNKGPDIYVGKINTRTPGSGVRTAEWSRWGNEKRNENETGNECRDGCGYGCDGDGDDSPFPWGRRSGSERYDFRRRRYQVPDRGTWSRVEYCDCDEGKKEGRGRGRQRRRRRQRHVIPRRYWDRNGVEYPAGYWHDVVYGRGDCDCDECVGC